jgi:hypothetical protein
VLTSFTNLWLFLCIWFVLLTSTCWHRIQTSDYSFVYDLSYWHQRVDIVYKPLTIPSYMICLIDINVLTSYTNLWLFLRIWFVLLTSTCWHRLQTSDYSFVYDLSYWHQRVDIVYKPLTIPSYMICLIDINVLTSYSNLGLFFRIWFVLLTSTCWHRLQTSEYSFVYNLSYWHQRVDIVYKPLTIPSYMTCLIDMNVLTSYTNLWLFLRIWLVLLTSTCWHRLQTSDYSFVYDLSYWHQRVDIVYKPLTIPSYMIYLIDINVLTSHTNLCSCNSLNPKFYNLLLH